MTVSAFASKLLDIDKRILLFNMFIFNINIYVVIL
jgi:hypothetical protein